MKNLKILMTMNDYKLATAADAAIDTINNLIREVETLEAERDDLQGQVDELKSEISDLKDEIKELQERGAE